MTNNSATTLLVRREARPWGEWIRPLNKRSDNALTRLLFLEIGALAADPNMKNVSSFDRADREIRAWLTKRSINSEGLVLDNGSGLSRTERVTARQMVSMLIKLSQEHRYHDLMMSLPVAGEDNTLKRRYTGSLANGSARLKTGSLWNVSAIAGVVYDRKQRPWMVSVMVNHPKASAAAPLITEIVDTIAAYDLD
jgi:D-alanyl-D-alanine carboxypeptidase/D-alanyl-D-alanine-endopeptidase (penicillin-binding protein 4)